ncbi:hypothetical protein [Paenibacillus riograndensis]|uniref:hypothetical protein n=1 Tax=Paenibacillus riograndensis TaxID=483937 RepID=UPI001428C5D9|nr:hypothetical protein [Paenibacillus riograndensis]
MTINEENNFSDIWESFCLKLLKLNYRTDEIERRRPPEQGIDLYYKKNKTAFQCKSTLKGSKFNITNACSSLRGAIQLKNILPWSNYIICSNENLTGDQFTKLQSIHPDIDIYGKDYWIGLCQRFPEQVKANFRVLCEIPENRIYYDYLLQINGELDAIQEKLKGKPINVLFYYHGHDRIYNLKISKELNVSMLLLLVRRLFKLHEITKEHKGTVQIKPYFLINNNRFDEKTEHDLTMEELGLIDGSCITLGLDFLFQGNQITRSIMYLNKDLSPQLPDQKSIIKNVFVRFDSTI